MKRIILVLCSLFVLSLSVFGQDALRRDLSRSLRNYDIVDLNKEVLREKAQTEEAIQIQAYGRSFEFVLTPNDLRAPNYRAVETGATGDVELGRSEVITFKGKLAGDELSEVRFNISGTDVEGMIYTGDRNKYFITLAENFSSHARANEAVVYKEEDILKTVDLSNDVPTSQGILEKQAELGLDILPSPPLTENVTAAADLRAVEVATEADFQWVNQAGGGAAANNEILSILNLVDGIYQRDLNLTIAVTYQHVWTTTDPFSSASSSALLDSFLNNWNTNFPRSQYPRDTAHLFTGKFSNQGIAYQGIICRNPNYAYGVTARSGGVNHLIAAHEIGHNLGAEHVDNSGSCATSLMNPTLTYGATAFCDISKTQINNYVASNGTCLTVSSGGGTPTPTPTPTATPTPTPTPNCTFSISPTSRTFTASGGTGTISVTASSACNWTAISNQNFVTITSGASGSGSGTVYYSVAGNSGSTARAATISVAGQTHTVQQSAGTTTGSYTLNVSPNSVNPGGQVTVSWTAPAGSQYADWIGLFKVGTSDYGYLWYNYTQGATSGSFTVTAPTTAGQYEFRYFTNNTFTKAQTSNPFTVGSVSTPTPTPTATPTATPTPTPTATPTPSPTPSCSFQISPTSRNFTSSGGTGSISVTATSGCNWTAVSDQSFVTITSGASGSGSGIVNYTVAATSGSTSRSAVITVAGLQHTIQQTGASTGSGYTLTASTGSVNPGGQLVINWTAPAGASYYDWIGLFRVGGTNYDYVWWNYTGGATSGSFTLNAPSQTGQYEFRYMLNNGFTTAQTSSPITVGSGGTTPAPTPTPTGRTNVALASNGAVASASSWYSYGYPISAAIDGSRTYGIGGAWIDNTPSSFPDWLQVDFNGSKTISEIDVYTISDNYSSTSAPSETETFTLYGIRSFDVQYWNGSSWVTIPNGSISNTNRVVTKITFSPVTTNKIRVVVNYASAGYSYIVELEAWSG